jgi:hypothetical protein
MALLPQPYLMDPSKTVEQVGLLAGVCCDFPMGSPAEGRGCQILPDQRQALSKIICVPDMLAYLDASNWVGIFQSVEPLGNTWMCLQAVKEAIAAIGEKISVRRFVKYQLGEGIEKKESNLAADVAAMSQKSA